jgi:hypothetical protein
MKQLVLVVATLLLPFVLAQAEEKKVCQEINGKKECKIVKTHKKAEKVTEGDPNAPEPKPAKKK